MNLYKSIDSYCSNYAIPLTVDTVGYLQFYNYFNSLGAIDINTIKYYQVNQFGVETEISALNTIGQYLGSSNFQTITQGLQLIEMQNFRIKMVVKMNNGTVETFYSDMFTFEQCGTSYALIPCLVDGQQYSVNDNFIGEIIGNIIYERWLIPSEKKYTPVAFIRNLSFNQKTNTIEYNKLNNKPLRTTLKKDYKFKSEPIPEFYVDTINEVFAFGKVNLLSKTFAFDTYSIDVIDENDCCSFYKINATAYIESKLRLLCSNNCVVLSPIDCSSYVPSTKNIDIDVDLCTTTGIGYYLNIVEQIQSIGYELGNCNEFTVVSQGTQTSFICSEEDYSLIISPVPTEGVDTIVLSVTLCGETSLVNINVNYVCCTYNLDIVNVGFNTDFTLIIVAETNYILEYSYDGITWLVYGNYLQTDNTISINLPNIDTKFRIKSNVAVCQNYSEIYNYILDCQNRFLKSVKAVPNPSGGCSVINVSFLPSNYTDPIADLIELQWSELNTGEVFQIENCIDLNTLSVMCVGRVQFIWDDDINCCD